MTEVLLHEIVDKVVRMYPAHALTEKGCDDGKHIFSCCFCKAHPFWIISHDKDCLWWECYQFVKENRDQFPSTLYWWEEEQPHDRQSI
jgi:hypothetical protein